MAAYQFMHSWPSIFTDSTKFQKENILKNSRNLNLQHTGIYLYSVYIVFTTAYIAFTLVRRFKQSRDDLKYKEDVGGCSRIT